MSYHLPMWKRIPKLDPIECNDKAQECQSALILETEEKEVKEALLKVKLDQTYEANVKALIAL